MTYRIAGLDPAPFAAFFAMDDETLARRGARRVIADSDDGYPCRIALDHAATGESLVLLNWESHEANSPYRTAYAIYVGERAARPAAYVDAVPPLLEGRALSLRGFDADGMLQDSRLLEASRAPAIDEALRELLADPRLASIHVHTARYGCFLAMAQRDGEPT